MNAYQEELGLVVHAKKSARNQKSYRKLQLSIGK